MSIEGYFDGIIETWNKQEHPTPCMIEDMKTVLKQFKISKAYEDISDNRLQDLTESFERIEKEIYEV